MEKYNHKEIEKKWQKYWEKEGVFKVKEDETKKKFYGLIEFPYASGEGLHTGHLRSNTAMDVICRKKRMQGYNVLYPIGFDNFGLPTENYAIKIKKNPMIVDRENTKVFTKQLKESGFSFDWSRSFSTTDSDYYKWTQWIFSQMFKNGLAYKAKENINWCTSCKIGLANEEVVNGACERCGGEVVKKEKEQWILKITKYADRLIEDLGKADYLERIKTQQVNWIGRKEWIDITYPVVDEQGKEIGEEIVVSTTRPDTNFGATFVVLAPEHSLLEPDRNFVPEGKRKEVNEYVEKAKKKSELERISEGRKKTGVFSGLYCLNKLTNKKMPIYVTDFVLMNIGTGAVVGVPGHDIRDFEFAQEFDLPVARVVVGSDGDSSPITKKEQVQEDEGTMVNSDFLDGLDIHEATKKIMDYLENEGWGKRVTRYHLRDWIFSRQRYWGEPIPMVYCEECGWVSVPDKDLPVKLPDIEDFVPTEEGDSPLAKAGDWLKTKCPKCGGEARRETDVMPNWAGSNWYFIRYCDPKNDKQMIDREKALYWLPVDWYNGGMEHTTLHLLYSRFVYKFLYDIGAVPKECGVEPYAKRTAHGMILAEGGVKMSKSKGNVINPDEYIEKYGADTVRVYEMFMGPFDQAIAWDVKGVIGVKRFLEKVWGLQKKLEIKKLEIRNEKLDRLTHQTIKKVMEDIENMRFNTAISQMMILVNEMEKNKELRIKNYELLVSILSPFAPHMCEELWERLGHDKSIAFEPWPEYDSGLIQEDKIELVLQVNGKVRDKMTVAADISEDEAKEKALGSEKVKKWLEGKEVRKVIFVKGKLVNVVI